MRSGHLLSLVAAAVLFSAVGVAVPASSQAPRIDGRRTVAAPAAAAATSTARAPDIPTHRGRQSRAVRQRRAGSRRAVRRRQQDGGRRLQRRSARSRRAGPARGSPSVCTMARRLRRRHPRRERGVRRRQHGGRRRLLRRLHDRRARLRVPRAGPHVRSRLRRRHDQIGMEQCDDGNTAGRRRLLGDLPDRAGRGCRARARPASAQASICGNGMKEGNEGCDCGTSITGPWPTGCKGPNGLFFGDATGCSKTCTQEPSCRTRRRRRRRAPSAAATATSRRARAATTATCDHGDGCSTTCTLEAGFMCSAVAQDRHRGLHADGQQRRSACSCRSSTATSRARTRPAATPTSSTWARPSPTRSAITGVQGQTGAISFNKRYCVSELERSGQEERLDQPLLGPGAADARRQREAGVQHGAHGRHQLRLPVHRLEPRRQRRPRARATRRRQSPTIGLDLHRRRQRPPDVPRPGAGRHQRDDLRPVVGRQHVHAATRTRSAPWR